jgi:uncharacterized circularly permuted ATP-grasp superfamily protein
MMIGEAVNAYHDLLTPDVAADAEGALNELLRARKCYFGTRPLCTVLRPNFYTPAAWAYLQRETGVILRAFAKAHAACIRDAALRSQLDLEAYEEALFGLDIGFRAPWTTSRLDSFFDGEARRLLFVEYNAETPAGMAYEDQLSEAFLELEPMRRFRQDYNVTPLHVRQHLLDALLTAYGEYGGTSAPQIAIIDWADVPTLNEHELCKEYFEAHGYRTLLADPRALEYRNGHLWAGDFRIDLIYKRVLCSELVIRMGVDNPVVKAVTDRAVCMSNAFSAKLMAKKASFAFVSDERNSFLFDPEERAAIEAHIPWTRRVQDRRTDFHGQQVDLLAYVAHHRENFVLKPNDDYGGKGVVIGWEVLEEEWGATLQHALTTPYVVQERVHAAYQDFPAMIDSHLNISPRLVDADPFVFTGQATHGCLTRLSTSSLLNVTAGGGSVVPTFLIEKR